VKDEEEGNDEEFSSSSDSYEVKESNVINTENEDIEMQLTKKKITKPTKNNKTNP